MSKVDQNLQSLRVLSPDERLKRQITDLAIVEIDTSIPPKRYYRSGLEMVRMANTYLEEGQLESAYLLYMKFMILFIEKIRTHPGLSTVTSTDKTINQQKLREVMPKAEQLKQQLLKRYEEDHQRYLNDELKCYKTIDANTAFGYQTRLVYAELETVLKRREEERRTRQENEQRERAKRSSGGADLPSVPHPSLLLKPVPPLPADADLHYSMEPTAPPRHNQSPPHADAVRPQAGSLVPGVDRSTKPHSLLSPTEGHSGRLGGLRTVVVPQMLQTKFHQLAYKNTCKNVETCGILAGRLDHDHLVISHLIVPKQHGGADYCNMEGEEQVCEYSDQRELLTLGWIHTHPTQSAFLSSVDLHTHFGYQLMMPEAIAIVWAPKYQEVKTFCLTPYHGLEFIKNCRKPGFHPHPNEPPLFMVAEHFRMDSSAPLDVVDFR